MDYSKYTDEGWYGNAAIRAHLFGSWYLRGDFNPAPAVPVWPFLEWLLFFFTGVSIQAARGLVVALFFANLLLSYLLLKMRGPQWMALLAVTLLVVSPFLYSFSRLAILEPLLITGLRVSVLRQPLHQAGGVLLAADQPRLGIARRPVD
jgi:predicted membrane-bound mannosyltransferase